MKKGRGGWSVGCGIYYLYCNIRASQIKHWRPNNRLAKHPQNPLDDKHVDDNNHQADA